MVVPEELQFLWGSQQWRLWVLVLLTEAVVALCPDGPQLLLIPERPVIPLSAAVIHSQVFLSAVHGTCGGHDLLWCIKPVGANSFENLLLSFQPLVWLGLVMITLLNGVIRKVSIDFGAGISYNLFFMFSYLFQFCCSL